MGKLAVDIGSTFGSPFGTGKGIGDLTTLILRGAISVASVIFLFLIISGGIGIISGAGGSSPEKVEKGKQAVTWGVIGFIIVLAAFWIIRIIEITTGKAFITNPGI